jgi:hypothetical protein
VTPVITLREIVLPPDDVEGEERPIDEAAAERIAEVLWGEDAAIAWAAWSAHLPNGIGDDGRPLGWSMREVRQLRFMRWLVDHAGLLDDIEAEA